MKKSLENCCLCSQIAGEKAGDLISELLHETRYVRRVAFESTNFAVIPSLGPIAGGHTLLCPKRHVGSFAALVSDVQNPRDSELREFHWISERLTNTLEELYSAPVHRFEHGSAADGSHIACSVGHAHLHFLPARVNIVSSLLADPIWRTTQPDLRAWAQSVGEREYLFYQAPGGEALVAADQRGYESQHMRRIFARALHIDFEWNWRTNPRPVFTDQVYKDISRAMGSAANLSGV
jgi:diadenosine tetraphosphate (Ap4A) HIT family hydrolase